MAARKQHSFLTLFLILVLCVNLLNVQTVYADGETPTEPPVPTQVETEPPTAEATEPPVPTQVETESPTEPPTEVPVEVTPVPVDSTPTSEPTLEPVVTETTATPIAEILPQIPESTEVVVIDETGMPVPLASEEAAEIVSGFDPMWCPAGVLPGGTGCTDNFPSISELITELINNTSLYAQNGIIYFVATTGVETTGASLNLTSGNLGGAFNTLNNFNLTLQGGWNGQNGGSATFTGTTNFGTESVSVGGSGNPWAGNVTLNNFSFNSGTQTQVNVYTSSGNITLSNVDVTNHGGGTNTAILNSTSGNITVQNGSIFDGNGSNSNGFVATTGTGSISISDTSFTDIVRNGSGSYNGATLSAPTVTLTNVIASANEGNGIAITNTNLVNLTNVTSGPNNNNSGNGLSGVLVSGTGTKIVSVSGGVFADNGRYGIEVIGGSIFIRSNPICPTTGNARNGSGCYSPNPSTDGSQPVITPTVSGTQGANGWYTSDVSVSWSVSDPQSGILSSSGCTTTNLTTETPGTTLTCTATNGANLSRSVSVTLKLDKTAPVTTLTVTAGNPGSNNWYRSNVTVHTGGSESLSGPITCTADQFQNAETNGTNFNGSCTNAAGLTGSASTLTIKVDKTNPGITFNGRTTPNVNGWNNTNVTANWTCSDSLSGPASDIVSQTVATEGAGQSATGTCTDLAGNTASDLQGGINIDKTAPSLSLSSDITAEATTSAGAAVTYSASVTDNLDANVTLTCAPASGSNFAIGSTTVNCSSTDQADNTANGSFLVQVGDTTGPVIASHGDITVEATSSSGTAVTYTNPTATDAVEGAVAVTCSPASGATFPLGDTTVTCNATDSLGNNATPTTFVVHVVDTAIPIIDFHADITVEATDSNGAQVNYTDPIATDLVDGIVPVTCSPASGSIFPLGDTTVTCNASDSSGNAAIPTTFVVHVIDTQAPTIIKHADVTAEATSASGAAVNYTTPPAVDSVDPTVSVTCAPASGATFPLGNTTVTCDASDSSGNAAQPITFVVHVVDTTAPVIASHADVIVQATSAAGAIANYSSPSTSDAVDGAGTATCTPASGIAYPMGDTTITCNASDAHGNTATPTTFVIHVVDTAGPVIASHADITAEATSSSGAAVTYTSPTATDAVDGLVAVSCSPASGGTFPLGNTTITCNATDSQNNSATPTTFVVHVLDTTAPLIADVSDITVEAINASGAPVNYISPATTDAVDGAGTATCSPSSGGTFPLGNTTVTCEATDQHQNTDAKTFVVHVVDTTAPVIANASDITVEATGPSGAQVTYTVPTATDAVDGSVTVTCNPASGTTFGVGNTTVTCNAMDTHNNMAAAETFTVHVVDTTAPVLTVPATINVNATGPGGAVVTFSATATDLVDTHVDVTCNPSSGSTFPVGANQVTCTATDNSGNQTQGSFFVNVMDPDGPILSLPANVVAEATSASGAIVTFTVTATDLVDGSVPVTCTPASGSAFGFGTTTVTCSAMDSSEHTNTGMFLVTVQDTTAPVIAHQSDISTETNSTTGVIVTYTSPTTTDAVDGAGIASCTPASGALFPVGDTTVTCTATDDHGNTSTSTFIVHVKLSKPGTTQTTTTTSGSIIPLTGGELIDLDCDSVLWAFGIKVSFFNLCDYQTTLNSIGASDLPAELPEGFSFVMGLDVDILSEGQFLNELPDGSGIEMDFPIYEQSADEFAVLFWSEADGKWIEVSEQINADEISQTLNTSAEDELYHILSDSLSDLFHQMLTAQKTGVFVLVKK